MHEASIMLAFQSFRANSGFLLEGIINGSKVISSWSRYDHVFGIPRRCMGTCSYLYRLLLSCFHHFCSIVLFHRFNCIAMQRYVRQHPSLTGCITSCTVKLFL